MKKFYTALICAICALPVFADDNKYNLFPTDNWLGTETWLQQDMKSTSRPPSIGANEKATDDPTVPLGNEVSALLALGMIYGCYVLKKNKPAKK